ncbi:CT20-domain-containing protein [Teratosphaeria nubilosa]|uniref:CT20-domain-containing protein n=1 Tax=Teratosphaeria nubilosa TaxID=161662 RepID=A0A6G1LH61_9PEZI|nr:CT20-domain-containing protein [Teratosphaeria nubilosa]
MPPRKKARVSQATSPSNPKTPTPTTDARPDDAWTDEEEIGLFKGLMTWKPTGIHKHFRLLALHQFLLTNHYIHPGNPHTRPAGIWRKLHTLYDLNALDEREDARQLSDLSHEEGGADDGADDDDETDVYSEAENKIHRGEFELPEAEYGERMWRARFAEREESPGVLGEVNLAREAPVRFTPSVGVEVEGEGTPAVRARGGKAAGARRGRGAGKAGKQRRSARQAEAGGEEGNDREEESEEDEGKESEASGAPARSTRAGRGRGRGGARGRARGRRK